MSLKIFQDKIFPQHISDLMNLMHMMVFRGTDGEEKWDTYLTLAQKEYVALGLAQYYQCQHCIDSHTATLLKINKDSKDTLSKNVNAIVLFLRIDTLAVSESEKTHWVNAWKRFATRIAHESDDEAAAYLIGLAIGIARNDDFLMTFCGQEVKRIFEEQGVPVREAVGELESVVIFMKAAASKNRVADKLAEMFE